MPICSNGRAGGTPVIKWVLNTWLSYPVIRILTKEEK